jgi:hypothetical protein
MTKAGKSENGGGSKFCFALSLATMYMRSVVRFLVKPPRDWKKIGRWAYVATGIAFLAFLNIVGLSGDYSPNLAHLRRTINTKYSKP